MENGIWKYLIKRLLRGVVAIMIAIAAVMILIYSAMDRNLVFANDPVYSHQRNNAKTIYKYAKWKEYGYLDYVNYTQYLQQLEQDGALEPNARAEALSLGKTVKEDSALTEKYVREFTKTYQAKGYQVKRLNAVMMGKRTQANGGQQQLFAYRDLPLYKRLYHYFKDLVTIDNIHNAQSVTGKRGLYFTCYDPAYGGKKFSPAILGNGTTHKYLLYFDARFPYLHQNLITIQLGKSYTVNRGVDVSRTMSGSQGSYVPSMVTYPTGKQEISADDLHSATYVEGSLAGNKALAAFFTDDYTNVTVRKGGMSKLGYSFAIGLIAVFLAYVTGIPIGVAMARKKEKLFDRIGTIYIVFIIAVPSLAYIFLFKAIGGLLKLPTTFDMETQNWLMFVLPIVSLALPSIANLMKWIRRYMIDQMNADYVKFARAGGLNEHEIFNRHILKNAAIPVVHGIPASVLGALTGAIITERVYVVPGAGNLLTEAINQYDNGVIIGVTLFYALLSLLSILLGDVLMSITDPRISFSEKDR